MDYVRMRNNSSSPPPTVAVDLATPLDQTDPLLSTPDGRYLDAEDPTPPSPPPSTTNSQYDDESLPDRPKPLFRGFERPSFFRIASLTLLCLVTYPAFYILTLVAKDRSLFIVRAIVSVWCSGVGFALGYFLLAIGARHIEAATWATVIHMSHGGDGMKLRDLARGSSNPTSFMPAFHIFRSRFRNLETSRRSRKSYDKRPWSLFLGFFIVLAILAPLLPFLFGRIVEIRVFVRNQNNVYSEVLIAGDLTQEDVSRAKAQLGPEENYSQVWSSFPYGAGTSDTAEFVYGNDTVNTIYLAQPVLSQFLPGGSGSGTFDTNLSMSMSLKDTLSNTPVLVGRDPLENDAGTVLRYPQWGIRIHCEKLPDLKANLVPYSNASQTYAFVPRDFLRGLFGVQGLDLPARLANSTTGMMLGGDFAPSNINLSTISYIVDWMDNGEGVDIHSIHSDQVGDQQWTTAEIVLIRSYLAYVPHGRFPVWTNVSMAPSPYGRLGHDVAVCVQKYEPWIIEAYNTSTGSPSILRIVEKGNGSTSLSPSGNIRGDPVADIGYLNTTGKDPAFPLAHGNTIGQIVRDNNGEETYRPTRAAVSFTDGAGPFGYTELSPDRLAITLGRMGAANTLPYLAGSGSVVAKSYADETLAYATYKWWQLIILPTLVWILGVIGELFVPILPFNVPRREFGVYSWLALFQYQELRLEAADELGKLTSLGELEEFFSDKRVKFAVEKGEI